MTPSELMALVSVLERGDTDSVESVFEAAAALRSYAELLGALAFIASKEGAIAFGTRAYAERFGIVGAEVTGDASIEDSLIQLAKNMGWPGLEEGSDGKR